MSGRIRTIKPELLEDAVTGALSDSAFRLFIAMILLADDYGNLRAGYKYLEGQVYWTAIPEKSVRDSCEELETLVTFYTVRGQAYAHINNWAKHQKVQHPGKPRVPAPLMNVSRDSHEIITPDLRPPTSDHDHRAEARAATFVSESVPDESVPVKSEKRLTPMPPRPSHPDSDIARVADAIRGELALHQVHHQAESTAEGAMPVGKRKPVSWLLEAVRDAARDAVAGESAHVTQKRLRSYLDHARAPRVDPTERKAPAHRESDDKEAVERIRKMPQRRTAQDEPAPIPAADQAARAEALMAAIGRGPGKPMSERQLADKAREDRERLLTEFPEEKAG